LAGREGEEEKRRKKKEEKRKRKRQRPGLQGSAIVLNPEA
jgi:hypothetical protein